MRPRAPLAAAFLAVLAAAAWTRAPAAPPAQAKPRAFRELLEEHVGQTCGFQSSYGRHYLRFPEEKSAHWQTTKLVEVGADFAHIQWDAEDRYVPLDHLELLVGKAK